MTPQIEIYTKGYCSYCDRAREFFEGKGLTYREVDVSETPEAYAELKARTQHMTVPQIFVDGEFIGGYTDMMEKVRAGVLKL
jgi:glutaredoxin